MIGSAIYPRWLGRIGLILGIPMIALGVVQTFTLRSTTLTLICAILMLLTALWDLTVGIWVAHRARQ